MITITLPEWVTWVLIWLVLMESVGVVLAIYKLILDRKIDRLLEDIECEDLDT